MKSECPKDPGRIAALAALEKLYFEYDFTAGIFKRIELFHELSRASRGSHIMILYGSSGTGKSSLVDHYVRSFNAKAVNAELDKPILHVEVPSKCSSKALASTLLGALGDPFADKGTQVQMTRRVAKYLEAGRVSMVILDEFQHFVDSENRKVNYEAADWLKELANKVACAFLIVGLRGTREVIERNGQLERRVLSKVELKRLPLKNAEDLDRLRTILALFAQELPFPNSSIIIDEEFSRRIHVAASGLIGHIERLLKLAGTVCLFHGSQELSTHHFEEAFDQLRVADNAHDGKLNPFG